MGLASNSFGMALTRHSVPNPNELLDERPGFWHDYATAIIWLNVAADRMIDYLRNAGFKIELTQQGRSNRNEDIFSCMTIKLPANAISDTNIPLDEVNAMVSKLSELRQKRN